MYRLWRQEDPILDENGLPLKGGMWKPQREWWKMTNYIKAMVAGYGSGKTFIGAKRAISLAILNKGQPHFWVSPSYKVAKRTVIPTLIELLEGKKTVEQGFRYKYNKTDNEFRINHRGRKGVIWIGSGDEPDSLKGPTVASATIDEPFIQSRDVFNQILARVRAPRALHREIGLLGTPEQLNWGYDICEGEEKKNFDIGVLHVATEENLALPREYVETLLRGYTDKMRQAYLRGMFVNLSKGAIYYGFSKERNVLELPDPGHDLCAGMDFNVNPMAAMIFWKHAQHMHVVSEIEIENADTEYMATILEQDNSASDCSEYLRGQIFNFLFDDGTRRVQTIYPDPTGKSRHTSSPGGQSDFTILRGDNFDRFELVSKVGSPRIRDRENAVNGKLHPVKGNPTLTIDPRCTKLIQYLLAYTHELRNKQKQMSHLIDALGYPIDYLYPITKPRVVVREIIGH